MNNLTLKDELTEFLLYTTPNSDIKVETYLHNETLWLPQKRIAELFGVDRTVVTKHLKNIYQEGELVKNITNRSTPIPSPAVGGMPYSRARI